MRTFAAAALAGFAVAYTPISELELKFINFIASQGKSYATVEEYTARMERFALRDAEINLINASQSDSFHAHNKFSDWTDFELKRMLGGKKDTSDATESTN
jgi:hypothetical protein